LGRRIRRFGSPLSLLLAMSRPGGGRGSNDPALMFRRADANSDGFVDWDEFRSLVSGSSSSSSAASDFIAFLYDEADIDRDGALNRDEADYLGHLAGEFLADGSAAEDPTSGRATSLHDLSDFYRMQASVLGEYDLDGDGQVRLDEFLLVLRDAAVVVGWDAERRSGLTGWGKRTFERTDITGDGSLDASETMYTMFLLRGAVQSGLIMKVKMADVMLEQFDNDSDGALSKREIDSIASMTERSPEGANHSDMALLMQARFVEADTDGDGRLDEDETLALIDLVFSP